MAQPHLQQHNIKYNNRLPAHFSYRARPIALKRALNNLLSNAVRYSDVVIETYLIDDHLLAIDILDQGPGIAEPLLEQVFEPFVRLDSARSLNDGHVGLGLAVARSCIRAHGGEVSLQNRHSGGLRAAIRLPC